MGKTLRTAGHRALLRALVNAREHAGLTQREFGALMGKPQSYVGKIETGERRIDPVELVEWADAAGISPLKLFEAFLNGMLSR